MKANANGQRKIERAIARGWTPAERMGPAAYLRHRERRASRPINGRHPAFSIIGKAVCDGRR